MRRTALRLAVRQAWADNVLGLSGALAYNLLFAVFPALITFVAALDLLGRFQPIVAAARDHIATLPPDSPWRALNSALAALEKSDTPALLMLAFGALLTLWTGSNYIGVYQWSVRLMRGAPGGRRYLVQLSWQLVLTVIAFVVMATVVAAIVLSGPLVARIGGSLGPGDTTRTLWELGRWPLLFFVVSVLFALFYQAAPGARRERYGLFTTGSVVAVVGWLVVTAGFTTYVRYIADYNRIYGTLGAFIAFLVWLWLFNAALLFSTEVDVALERVRAHEDIDPGRSGSGRVDSARQAGERLKG